ncbi:MAG: TrkH family potassium uptake protein [Rhodospirillales bacterium]
MPDLRPVLFVLGVLLTTLAVGMAVPAIVDLINAHDDWRVFAISAAVTLFVGVSLMLTHAAGGARLSIRQAFILTTVSWIAVTAFAALPFVFADLKMSYADAFFEAMSGITTTGSTVISGLDTLPEGILLWRAILHWFGGIGIIAVSVAILPMLQVGGMQLFRMESSDRSEKVMPRAQQIASGIGLVYIGLSVTCAILLWACGMSLLDSVTHAMATVSTGGFSTKDSSVGYFDNAYAEVVIIVFMLLGALPFVVYLRLMNRNFAALYRDQQVRTYVVGIVVAIVALALWRHANSGDSFGNALRETAFNLISILTTTGFVTTNYEAWGAFPAGLFLVATFIGGCSGSTSGGLKVYRFQILFAAAKTEIYRLIQPHGIRVARFNGRPIDEEVVRSVMAYFYLYVIAFCGLTVGLAFCGLDTLTAVSGAATAIGNVGPGLGAIIGPDGNFSTLSDLAKWMLSAGMLLGRLEIFTVIVLFSRTFWRG